jgi:hypothetical protein
MTSCAGRELIALLAGAHKRATTYGHYGPSPALAPFGVAVSVFVVPEQCHTVLVPRLYATRRCYLSDDPHPENDRQLRWDARAWAISLDTAPDHRPESTGYLLTGWLSRDPDARQADVPAASSPDPPTVAG